MPFQGCLENNVTSNRAESASGADYSATAARILSQIWEGIGARISAMAELILPKAEVAKKVKIAVKQL
jgi:hypothetical protein